MSEQWNAAWADLRSRRRWFFGWWLGGLVVLVAASMLVALLGGGSQGERWVEAFAEAGALCWFVGSFVLACRLFFAFRCPRCAQLFYVRGVSGEPFTAHCRHCGLARGALAG
jgi:hypothetical protein